MGMQIARKLAESGDHHVIAHNRSHEPIEEAVGYGATAAYEKQDVTRRLWRDQVVLWIMLPNKLVDEQIERMARPAAEGEYRHRRRQFRLP
jgi:6-phosphogluconate dehydrogenase (decarboxylating)